MADSATHDHPSEPEQSGIQYLNRKGEWESIASTPSSTGDTDLDYLWDLPIDEFDRVLGDPEHPLHEKAQQVGAELIAPLKEAINAQVGPSFERLAKRIQDSVRVSIPKVEKGGIRRSPVVHPVSGTVGATSEIVANAELKGLSERSTVGDVMTAFEAASVANQQRTADAAEAQLAHSRQVETNRLAEADVQKDRALRTEIAGWIAAVGAVGAVLVGVATIIVTIAVSR